MPRSVFLVAALCVFSTTLYSGCVFYEEDCDYVETQCWDVVDVYCDPWGCWEDWYTECEDYCVNVAEPTPAPECTSDRHCGPNQICSGDRCVAAPTDHGQSGLCQTCDVNADCSEDGALCLNLTAGADVGFCGRSCGSGGDCPSGFECVGLQGASGSQCVPLSRVCEGGDVFSCENSGDCLNGEVCDRGICVTPAPPECIDASECAEGQECVDGACSDPAPECIDASECAEGQECVDGACTDPAPECTESGECNEGELCMDGTCQTPECGNHAECSETQECVDGACLDVDVSTCDFNSDCESVDGICVDGTCRRTCEDDLACPGDTVCRAGLCAPPPEPECSMGDDCGEPGEFRCVNGMCKPSCEIDEECDFGYLCRVGTYCDPDPAVECRSTLECGIDERCHEGSCLVECAASCNCPEGLSCDEGLGLCMDLGIPDSCEDTCDCPGGYECGTELTCELAGD